MIPNEAIKIAVAGGWTPLKEGAGAFTVEFAEWGMYVNIGGEISFFHHSELALDASFWEAVHRWLVDHNRASPGARKLALGYMEAILDRRDLRAWWERTVDAPVKAPTDEEWTPEKLKKPRRGR